LAVLLTLGILASGHAAWGQTRPTVLELEAPPATAIYLDRSLFFESFRDIDGLGGQITSLLLASGATQRFRTAPVTLSGERLHWHDAVAFLMARPTPRTSDAGAWLDWRSFDIAILADCGDCPAEPRAMAAWIERTRRDAETVRREGGQPVLFMPWAVPQGLPGAGRDAAAATRRIAEATTRAGNAAGALVIPAGLAFARAQAARPDLVLLDEPRQPSRAGSYLAAVVSYAALFGASPVGNRATGGLDPATAGFLQRVAWETAWEFYAGRPPPE
jgi:hypothetical protein